MKRPPNKGARARKLRRDTAPSILEHAVMDVRRCFRMGGLPAKSLLLAARALISRSQEISACSPPKLNDSEPTHFELSDEHSFLGRRFLTQDSTPS